MSFFCCCIWHNFFWCCTYSMVRLKCHICFVALPNTCQTRS